MLRLKCSVHTSDHADMDIVSGTKWKQIAGPIVADNIYNGETFDASMETIGWDTAVSSFQPSLMFNISTLTCLLHELIEKWFVGLLVSHYVPSSAPTLGSENLCCYLRSNWMQKGVTEYTTAE